MQELVYLQLLFAASVGQVRAEYYGTYVGRFGNHKIQGHVFAVDEAILFVKNFTFDSQGSDAYFWVGRGKQPSPAGTIVPYPYGFQYRETPPLKKFQGDDILLRLPAPLRLSEISWLCVWSRRFTINFGAVHIPRNLRIPRPKVLDQFRGFAHGLSSGNVTILDMKTLYIPNLHYDGQDPPAFFWVGKGPEPSLDGISLANEVGRKDRVRRYSGEDIQLTLPSGMTVADIDWLSIWSVLARQDFGHVMIPRNVIVPPSLGQTKVTTTPSSKMHFSNCIEPLPGKMQIRWALNVEDAVIQLSGKFTKDQYMAFGISTDDDRSSMVGSDVTIVSHQGADKSYRIDDYFVSSKVECDGKVGVCPDVKLGGQNNIVFQGGEHRDGIVTVTYRKPLVSHDPYDLNVTTDRPLRVVAAIGALNHRREPTYHADLRVNPEDDLLMNFGKVGEDSCPSYLSSHRDGSRTDTGAWSVPTLEDEHELHVRVGPSGGDDGYEAITGRSSWGMVWWINGYLAPVIIVVRGQTYNFTVEGGDRPDAPAHYHPLYITSSPEGGYGSKSAAERRKEVIFAGVHFGRDGDPHPTAGEDLGGVAPSFLSDRARCAAGRLCEYRMKLGKRTSLFRTFDDYRRAVHLRCDPGEPGALQWVVAHDTPDVVYYQCFVHRNMGWKILVTDPGDGVPGSSADMDRVGILRGAVSCFVPLLLLGCVRCRSFA